MLPLFVEGVVRVLHHEHAKRNRDEGVDNVGNEVPDAVVRVLLIVQEERKHEVQKVRDDGRRNLLRNVQKKDVPFPLRALK